MHFWDSTNFIVLYSTPLNENPKNYENYKKIPQIYCKNNKIIWKYNYIIYKKSNISIYDEEKGKIDCYLHKDEYRIFLKYKVKFARITYKYEYNTESNEEYNAERVLTSEEKKLDSKLNKSFNRVLMFFQSREQLYDKFGLEPAYYIYADSYCWGAMLKNEDENYDFRISYNNKIFLCKK